MRPADALAGFVRDALSAGHSRAATAAALRAAGWSEAEVAGVLEAWADTPLGLPAPRPRRVLSAAEAFRYGLAFLALAVTVGQLASLSFALFDRWLPQPGEAPGGADGIRWALAVLVVAFPLFFWLDRRATRALAADPGRQRSPVRRWIAHLALFLAVVGLLGNLVAVVYAFLSGDLTLRFGLKAAVVAGLALTVLAYYRPARDETAPPPARPAVWLLAGLVGGALALGLWATGGPAQARAEARDRVRLADLQALARQVACLADTAGALPAGIEGTETCPLTARTADPYRGTAYGYARLSDRAFRLCAPFETAPGDAWAWAADGFDAATGCLTFRHLPPPGGG